MDVDSNSQENIDQAIDYLGLAQEIEKTDKSQAKELYKLASDLSGLKINKRNIQESLDFLKTKSRRAPTYQSVASETPNYEEAYNQYLFHESRHGKEFCGTIEKLINDLSQKINSLHSDLYGNTITKQDIFNEKLNEIKEIEKLHKQLQKEVNKIPRKKTITDYREYCRGIIENYRLTYFPMIENLKQRLELMKEEIEDTKDMTSHENIVQRSQRNGFQIPPIFQTPTTTDYFTSFKDKLDTIKLRKSSDITKIILGVKNRGKQKARNEGELNEPAEQAKIIANTIEYDEDSEEPHQQSLRPFHKKSEKRFNSCYGTKQMVSFGKTYLVCKNEWEHVVPSLLQFIINGLPSDSTHINMSLALPNIFGQGHFPVECYQLFEDLCIRAQNRMLLLSCTAFNQSKCSLMLYNVEYGNVNGNHIIQLSVNNKIANIVHEHMIGKKNNQSIIRCERASTFRFNRKEPKKTKEGKKSDKMETKDKLVLSLSTFKKNLQRVADNYNEFLQGNGGLNGLIVFGCGSIYSSFLAYNSISGEKEYNKLRANPNDLPIIYHLARSQINLLKSKTPEIIQLGKNLGYVSLPTTAAAPTAAAAAPASRKRAAEDSSPSGFAGLAAKRAKAAAGGSSDPFDEPDEPFDVFKPGKLPMDSIGKLPMDSIVYNRQNLENKSINREVENIRECLNTILYLFNSGGIIDDGYTRVKSSKKKSSKKTSSKKTSSKKTSSKKKSSKKTSSKKTSSKKKSFKKSSSNK